MSLLSDARNVGRKPPEKLPAPDELELAVAYLNGNVAHTQVRKVLINSRIINGKGNISHWVLRCLRGGLRSGIISINLEDK